MFTAANSLIFDINANDFVFCNVLVFFTVLMKIKSPGLFLITCLAEFGLLLTHNIWFGFGIFLVRGVFTMQHIL